MFLTTWCKYCRRMGTLQLLRKDLINNCVFFQIKKSRFIIPGGGVGRGSFGPQSGQAGHCLGVANVGCWLHWRVHSWRCTHRWSPKSKRVGQAHKRSTDSNPPSTVGRHCQNMFGSEWGHRKRLLPTLQLAPQVVGWGGNGIMGSSTQGGHQSGISAWGKFGFLHPGHVAGRRLGWFLVGWFQLGWFLLGWFHWAKAVIAKQLRIMKAAEK